MFWFLACLVEGVTSELCCGVRPAHALSWF